MTPIFGDFALRIPFLVAAAMTTVNLIYGFFILPESLAPENRIKKFDWRKANPVGSLKFLRVHRDLVGLSSVGFLFQLAHTVLPSIFVLYAGYRYHWTSDIIGLTMMCTGLFGVLVQIFAVGPVVKRIGERGALLLGALGGSTGFLLTGLSSEGWMYLASAAVFTLSNFLQPGLQGLMTRRVGPQEQGQLQGANQALQGIGSVLGPLIFNGTFAWAIHQDRTLHMPGLPIFIASGLLLCAFLLAIKVGHAPGRVEATATA